MVDVAVFLVLVFTSSYCDSKILMLHVLNVQQVVLQGHILTTQ